MEINNGMGRLKLPPAESLARLKRAAAAPFNFEAVFSDESEPFTENNPPEPGGAVTLRLRLMKGQGAAAYLRVRGDKPLPMRLWETAGIFDYYQITLTVHDRIDYCFIIKTRGGRLFYYNKGGVSCRRDAMYDFAVIPGFRVPEWAKGAVMYQIYVDRFRNGDPANDPVNNEYAYMGRAAKHRDWDDPVPNDDICGFYGGDLLGVMDKLPYLRELGVEAIYLNPVFVSPSNHKYDIQDYDHIDPHLGVIVNDGGEPLYFERFNNAYATKYMRRITDPDNLFASDMLFIRLVEEAHRQGIRVILDGVFNHCGAFNKWMDREGFYHKNGYPPGAYAQRNSPYNGYFTWNGDYWPNNDDYDCWWGHKNHPKLRYESSRELYNYILEVGRKWVSPPYNADGWRLDVAADLGETEAFNHQFWRDFRRAVKAANPEALILAEHYGDATPWLAGDQWDTVMNYDAFMEPVTWFLCGMEKHSQEYRPELVNNAEAFLNAMNRYMARFSSESLHSAMNQLSNHDHSRFLTRTNRTPGRLHTLGRNAALNNADIRVMRLAVLMQMTWPGSPCIYYGDEAGLPGWTDPDNRRPFPWGKEDKELQALHKALAALRKTSAALRRGSFIYLTVWDGVLCYGRFTRGEAVITAVNNTEYEASITLPVWKMDVAEGRFKTPLFISGGGFSTSNPDVSARNGLLKLEIPGKGGVVLRYAGDEAFS